MIVDNVGIRNILTDGWLLMLNCWLAITTARVKEVYMHLISCVYVLFFMHMLLDAAAGG